MGIITPFSYSTDTACSTIHDFVRHEIKPLTQNIQPYTPFKFTDLRKIIKVVSLYDIHSEHYILTFSCKCNLK